MKQKRGVIATGMIIGLVSICLGMFGNPANMAFCIACFLRDMAGAIGLHRAEAVQYIRPEIVGIVIGALVMSMARKEFAARAGSSPFTRFILGVCVMVGALIFLGCPLRMLLRIAGGDVNAVIGLVGFVGGILTGVLFLNRGFTLRRSYDQPIVEGLGFSVVQLLLFMLLVAAPSFVLFSQSGPGSMHAPILLSLAGGLIVGTVAQRSRLCFISGVRDAVMFKDFRMLLCFGVIVATVLIGNLVTGKFHLGLTEQPVAHIEWLWNVLGLYLVGFASVLLGGCPLRQLVMAGSGNGDAGITVLGFVGGAAICHNFGLASSSAGTTFNGRIAFLICTAIVFIIAFANTKKGESA